MHTTVDKDRFQSSPMNSSPAISDILQLYHPLAVASMVLWLYCYYATVSSLYHLQTYDQCSAYAQTAFSYQSTSSG